MPEKYEQDLLAGWEDVYKKGQLTLWILLALRDGPKHMQAIKTFIASSTKQTLSADDKSMYRALRRYHGAEMIAFTIKPNTSGPDHKVYALTPMGVRLLTAFCERNISNVFYQPSIQKLIAQTGEK